MCVAAAATLSCRERSCLCMQITNPNSPQAPGVLLLNIKGRVVPDGGGHETQVDCNLLYNVSTTRDDVQAAPEILSAAAGAAVHTVRQAVKLATAAATSLQSSLLLLLGQRIEVQ